MKKMHSILNWMIRYVTYHCAVSKIFSISHNLFCLSCFFYNTWRISFQKRVVLTMLHIYVFIVLFYSYCSAVLHNNQDGCNTTSLQSILCLYGLVLFINSRLDINNILSCPWIQILNSNCSGLRSRMSWADISMSRVVSYSFSSVC